MTIGSTERDDILETLKQRISRPEAIKRTGKTSAHIAVAANKQAGEIVIRFGDCDYSISKKKALALADKIQKKASELQ